MKQEFDDIALTKGQIVVIVVANLAAMAALILWGAETVRIFLTVITTLGFISVAFSFVMLIVSLVNPTESEGDDTVTSPYPKITVLSPMAKEARVARRHVRSANRLIWPRGQIEFLPLIREDDEETFQALHKDEENLPEAERMKEGLPESFRVVRIPPSHYGTKPFALRWVLEDAPEAEKAKGEFFIILDAENQPEPLLLAKMWQVMKKNPQLAAVQGVPVVSNWRFGFWQRMQGAEYASHYRLFNPALIRLGLLTPLPGNSVLFRTQAVHEVGGYEPYNKAEDAALSVALYQAGWEVASVDAYTKEEAPTNWRDWMRQRRRWLDGFLQTFFFNLRNPVRTFRNLGWANSGVFLLLFGIRPFIQLVNPLVFGLTILYIACLTPQVSALNPELVAQTIDTLQWVYSPTAKLMGMIMLFGGSVMFFYSLVIGCMHQKMWKSVPFMILEPVYRLFQSVAQVWATIDYLTGAEWHLTPHENEEATINAAPTFVQVAVTISAEGDD